MERMVVHYNTGGWLFSTADSENVSSTDLGFSLDFEESISDCGKRVLIGISIENYYGINC